MIGYLALATLVRFVVVLLLLPVKVLRTRARRPARIAPPAATTCEVRAGLPSARTTARVDENRDV